MKIITLTLNPAFDAHLYAENFKAGGEYFFDVPEKEAGGKGVNVSRALDAFGVKNAAIVAVGRENGEEFIGKLKTDGVNVLPVFVEGKIRENITIHEKTGRETRVSFNGFSVDSSFLNEVAEKIGETDGQTIIALSGSLPEGADKEEVKILLKKLKEKGTKIIIDCRSLSINDIEEIKPFLIKPNEEEAAAYIGREIADLKDAEKAAADLCERGIENVLITLGGKGAALACDEGVFSLAAPEINALSTIGAGDSSIAGFTAAYFFGKSKKDCFSYAVAFGAAACLKRGTTPPEKRDIIDLYAELI